MTARRLWLLLSLVVVAAPSSTEAQATFSRTEFQYQGGSAVVEGDLSPPGFQHTLTLQHASGWSHGNNFFFVDLVCCEDPVSNRDMYLEWYSTFSLSALTDEEVSFGPVRDIGLIAGLNWGAQSRTAVFGPGVRLALDLPAFAFANLDFMWLLDRSGGLESGGAPRGDARLGIDFNWARPFALGEHAFSVEGHGEWQSPRDVETGGRQPYTVLLQPQIRWDLGKAMGGAPGRVLIETELQVWRNKFSVDGVHEFLPQLLFVWGF